MSVNDIRMFGPGQGTRFIPEWGDDASPNWSESEWRSFGNPNGEYFGGGWEGEPGTLLCDPYPYDEVCIMISGRVALIDLDGNRREFSAGEAFFVPQSFRGTWETVEPSRSSSSRSPDRAHDGGNFDDCRSVWSRDQRNVREPGR
ncbi:cupin domain-containing protein [Rhodococcus sp. RCBS9]|uniref:cupin domain-containing protein n=1 Tax=Rhodococcus sp. RCBS9 TaxID=3031999 RepID=UPI0024029B52|nr:cupin domain-containing protein [Rhodococcus sp. RCBS9]WEX05739.1 cupin domain-containing protein [Rhodococcus sp. RCBS9]